MADNRPIAVFDSGVGGISVLRELYALMPNENYIYYGDSANAPYGSREVPEVLKLSKAITEKLMAMNAKAIVIACNTATSVAAEALREQYKDFPIIGVEPALKPAVLSKENPTVLVMATPITLREKKFKNLMERFSGDAKIIPVPSKHLAGMIERGITEGKELSDYLEDLFLPYKDEKIDAVVLGCTHYPFVKSSVKKVLGDVEIFDGGEGTARETKRRLEENNLLSDSREKGTVLFINSKDSEDEIAFCKKLFEIGG